VISVPARGMSLVTLRFASFYREKIGFTGICMAMDFKLKDFGRCKLVAMSYTGKYAAYLGVLCTLSSYATSSLMGTPSALMASLMWVVVPILESVLTLGG
jgi:hypothetical protein